MTAEDARRAPEGDRDERRRHRDRRRGHHRPGDPLAGRGHQAL